MSFFGVTIETIGEVKHHPNADRLDICKLKDLDYQTITGRGDWNVGDSVLYFPVDALLPDHVSETLGVQGKLAGSAHDRVKTIKLRQKISQGLVGPLSLVDGMTEEKTSVNLTKYLGVQKWEREPNITSDGILLPLPDGLSMYDIERCERYQEALDDMRSEEVYITEKLEGTNVSVFVVQGDDKVYVNQRNNTIEEIQGKENIYWKTATQGGVIDFAKWIISDTINYGSKVAVYGELIGPKIQSNIYKLKTRMIYVFDIKIDGEWVNKEEMYSIIEDFNRSQTDFTISHTPLLFKGKLNDYLDGRTLKEASDGTSQLHGTRREGVVIVPAQERSSEILQDRLILKQHGPEYLAGQ